MSSSERAEYLPQMPSWRRDDAPVRSPAVRSRERRAGALSSARLHPESGEYSLVVGHFVKSFVGLNNADSQRLIGILQDHITKPENTVRWHWRAGDVAIWDNRATQHRAIADFGKERRHLRRVTLEGPVAIGIDGQPSRLLKLEPGPQAANR
jgi:alkyl sulfatase